MVGIVMIKLLPNHPNQRRITEPLEIATEVGRGKVEGEG